MPWNAVANLINNDKSFIYGLINSGAQYAMSNAASKKAYHYQSNLLNRQNAFAEKVMKNSHQWEKEDLLNAGINPLLTATGGSGASASGVTSAPSVQKADTPDLSKIMANSIEAKVAKAQIEKINAETQAIKGGNNWIKGKLIGTISNSKAGKIITNLFDKYVINNSELNKYDKTENQKNTKPLKARIEKNQFKTLDKLTEWARKNAI